MSQQIEVKVPDIGDYSDIPVIEICVAVGDTVKVDDALVTLESDKATMDVPSSVAGVVREIRVALGDRVSQGSIVAVVALVSRPVRSAMNPAARVRLNAMMASTSQALIAMNTPDGRCASGPCLRSAWACSMLT